MRIGRINAHCVCIDLVGRVITIRFAYKGMHQGGNKSGAHRESICFHLHGRPARMGRRGRDEHPAGRDTRKTKAGRGERTVFERRDREIPRAIYGTVIEIPRTTGPAFAKHVRTRDLLSRKTAAPRDRPRSGALLVFLGRNNTKCPMSS